MKVGKLKAGSKQGLKMLVGINRAIVPSQVTKLAKSVKRMGVIRDVVVAHLPFVTGSKTDLYIIDGQHLYHALLREGTDIDYKILEGDAVKDMKSTIETIALLNASSKSWSMKDYVNAWAPVYEDYVKLNKYHHTYDFELGILAAILSNKTADSSRTTNIIKDGEFRIFEERKNVQILDQLTDVFHIIPRMNRHENKYVCREYVAFIRTLSHYNHENFLKNLAKNRDKFVLATQGENTLADMFKKLL